MKGKFAWVVSSHVLASIGSKGGVAAHYALPAADLADVTELPGSLVYIATYLLACGRRAFQSSSIDLVMADGTRLSIFEIKSMNGENADSQVAKGLFQLLRYSDALLRCGRSVSSRGLIVKANLPSEALAAYRRILTQVGVSLLVYNPAKAWPDRLLPHFG